MCQSLYVHLTSNIQLIVLFFIMYIIYILDSYFTLKKKLVTAAGFEAFPIQYLIWSLGYYSSEHFYKYTKYENMNWHRIEIYVDWYLCIQYLRWFMANIRSVFLVWQLPSFCIRSVSRLKSQSQFYKLYIQ